MVVDSPSPEVGAIHVAVGVNVVWAITKDNKVGEGSSLFILYKQLLNLTGFSVDRGFFKNREPTVFQKPTGL